MLVPGLGWLSVGLGLVGLLAPRRTGGLIGLRPKHDLIIRIVGLRDLASGVGILTRRRPAAAVWSRVAGDVVDLGLLSAALGSPRTNRSRLATATAGVVGVTALDLICASRLRDDRFVEPGGRVRLEKTGGRGPDSCMDAVGLEAHAPGLAHDYDRFKQALMLESDRPHVLRQAMLACRNGGTVSVPGVYGGFDDKIPIGAMMNKGLTIKSGQTHVPRYFDKLLEGVKSEDIDPSFVITHRMRLEDAPDGYETFSEKQDDCIKIVMTT